MENIQNRFEHIAKIILFIIAAALPLWFVPLPVGVEFGRELTFGILILLGAVAWLLHILTQGEIRWRHSIIWYAALALLVVLGVSTLFSKAPWVSALGADPVAERFLTLVLGVVLMALVANVFRSREEAGITVFLLVFSGALAGVLSVLQFWGWSPWQLFLTNGQLQFLKATDFNVVGTVNSASLFYAALFIMSVGLLFTAGVQNLRPWVRWALWASPVIFFVNILLVHFRMAWIVILGSAIVLFGLTISGVLGGELRGRAKQLDWRFWGLLSLLVLSVVMLMFPGPLFTFMNLPAEVSPSFLASLRTSLAVFTEGVKSVFLGSGPGTFGLDWQQYKDPSINQTLFWNVRFNQGQSWFVTLIATTGLLGALAFLTFLGLALFVFLRNLLLAGQTKNNFTTGVLLGFVALVISFFLYPANFTVLLTMFLLAGLATFLLSSEGDGKFGIEERRVRFEAPWAVFISSLVVIFLLSFSVAGLWLETNRIRTAFARVQGASALNRGDLERAVNRFERVTILESENFRNHQALVQVQMQKIRELIVQASGGANVQQEFQSIVSRAVDASRRATTLNPVEPLVWRTQGALYELIIPFIQGAESFSFSSYQRASELDPLNPTIYVEWGRSQMVFADRLGFAISQTRGGERTQLEQARASVLESAERAFQRAIEVKADHAPAHFLLAQAAIRKGNLRDAIRNTENARISAPFDIGVAFQLGLLYYQNDNLALARSEFERALSINANYSNARYFLGLIYSRQGERERAIEEFERIQVFNPDNDEVRRILVNLRAGKSALAGITPPPEDRTEPPFR